MSTLSVEPTMEFVDISLIEENKENIVPLREGRKVSQLATHLALPTSKKEVELKEARDRFEYELSQLHEVEDPLDIYVRYINWTKENYPEGQSALSNMLSLLERACFGLAEIPHYKEDVRYLKLWIAYIKYAESPLQIFRLLSSHGIGNNLATRYEEEAAYLEKIEKFEAASEVYERGIQSNAHPIVRLKKNFESFNQRFALFKKASDSSNKPKREVLTLKSGVPGPNIPLSKPLPIKNSSEIFQDPDGESSLSQRATASIKKYGPKLVRTRENIQTKTQWDSFTIPQVHVVPPIKYPLIEIYKDEEPLDTSNLSSKQLSLGGSLATLDQPSKSPLAIKKSFLSSKLDLTDNSFVIIAHQGKIEPDKTYKSFEELRVSDREPCYSRTSKNQTKPNLRKLPSTKSFNRTNTLVYTQSACPAKPNVLPRGLSTHKKSTCVSKTEAISGGVNPKGNSRLERYNSFHAHSFSGSSESSKSKSKSQTENLDLELAKDDDSDCSPSQQSSILDSIIPGLAVEDNNCPELSPSEKKTYICDLSGKPFNFGEASTPSARLLLSHPTARTLEAMNHLNSFLSGDLDHELVEDYNDYPTIEYSTYT